ncbi:ATP-binding cassette domain-containing protein [Pontibacter amylolyticus]|uniref:ABC transporter ATP-binding protein n=1 Tax=Pontibacter amylolyticus TaxID=1424080 RepID=A0ABQ1WFU1_9BACT|nr:ATP-binding cassette domain-containing protein [Pontibacter amylolyticus]GGG29033.1 ABC transporter ATP-binding protein [Pontibacter amylolyticus]
MSHKLEADSIQLAFDGRRILSDIYLKCETGGITGLLGRNGQGKSCLMKIIYGSLKCDKSIRFDNKTQFEAFKRPDLLLYLPQFNFIPPHISLKRVFSDFELDFPAFVHQFPEFTTRYKSSVGKLSGGERRLVEIYSIVKSASQFAMLDEPFTHLNPIQIDKVKDFLSEEKQNKGLIITDHMFRHVLDICDTLYVLTNGKTHLVSTVEEIEELGYARV